MSDMKSTKHKRAVLVSISLTDDGLHLSLDDVQRQDSNNSGAWIEREHYTSKVISEKVLDDMSFEEKELADFGYAILARLYAFKARKEI
jgi:hypothetical protein